MLVCVDPTNHIVGFSEDDVIWHVENGYNIFHIDSIPELEHQVEDYLFINGEIVYDKTMVEEREASRGYSPLEAFVAVFAAKPEIMEDIPDEDLAHMAPYMTDWDADSDYTVGDIRSYYDKPYRCLQTHHSQENWNPEDSPSLWARILGGQDGSIGEWEQPDSTNPYMIGDHVMHNGSEWVSIVDNNVWEPGVYGWDLVNGESGD